MRIDRWLPQYDFNEVHQVMVKASPQTTFVTIKELLSWELSPLVFVMLSLRALPAILTGRAGLTKPEQKPSLDQFYEDGFLPLDETPDEIVLGVIGQFWKPVGGEEASGHHSHVQESFDLQEA